MLVALVVLHAVGRSVVGIPEPLAVPVGLGEVAANHESLVAEGLEDVFGGVGLRIVGKGTVGDAEVGVLAVEEAEAVVVLRGENHVAHAGVFHGLCPLVGVELRGIEHVAESPVPLFVALIGELGGTRDPVLIADLPRLHDAWHGIESPVHQHAELLVLPLVEVLQYGFVGGPFISVRLFVNIAVVVLGRSLKRIQGEDRGD